ncbi:MAG: hypothetical protein KAS16_02395 [Thermoplasmata archaeon]|nr:hypothetical protein [Thermoplasmata archaeon]
MKKDVIVEAPPDKKGRDKKERKPYALFDEMDSLYAEYRMAFDEMFWPRGSAAPRIVSGKQIRAMPTNDAEEDE